MDDLTSVHVHAPSVRRVSRYSSGSPPPPYPTLPYPTLRGLLAGWLGLASSCCCCGLQVLVYGAGIILDLGFLKAMLGGGATLLQLLI